MAVVAVVLPLLVAAVLAPARDHLAAPTVALLLVLVVVTVAAVTGRRLVAALAAVSAALGFDYFHTVPYGSLSIRHSEDVQIAVLLVVVAGLVGELAVWGRRNREAAVTAQTALAVVASLSEAAGRQSDTEPYVLQLAVEIGDLLGAVDCRFEGPPAREGAAVMGPNGEITYSNMSWDRRSASLPGREVVLPVMWRGRSMGQFVVAPTPGLPVSTARRHAALVLAGLAGARLEQTSR